MKKRIAFILIAAVTMVGFPIIGWAQAWGIIPNQSSITFTAIQNNAPVTAQFKAFSGKIIFDPDKLQSSQVEIIINMSSVSASYKELTETLKTPDWFDVALFPQAIFKANQFTKIEKNNYQAAGMLTIRDKVLPVTLNFTLEEYTVDRAKAIGAVVLKRTRFGVGQGKWANTDEIKDDVKVEFVLTVKAI